MEFTLDAALSGDAVMGHAAYVMLIASMLMRTLLWLRLLVIVSACLGIAYAGLILHDPVSTFWETLLVLVNIVQILRSHWASLRARFTQVEAELVARHMPGLDKGQARALLDEGQWVKFPASHQLCVEGQPVAYLYYLASGSGDVEVAGQVISHCNEGHFVGEMTVMTGLPATATVTIASASASLWRIEAARLRALLESKDTVARELDAAFARNYREKLGRMNRRAVDGFTAV